MRTISSISALHHTWQGTLFINRILEVLLFLFLGFCLCVLFASNVLNKSDASARTST